MSWQKAGELPCSDRKRGLVASDGAIYVTARRSRDHQGGLFVSRDDGKSWQQLFANKFAQGLAVDPRNPQRVLLGLADHPYHDKCLGDGVYLSQDGGQSRRCLHNERLHKLTVTSAAFDPANPNELWIGAGGNAIFRGSLE